MTNEKISGKICEKKGCGREARFAPEIWIPAQGWPAVKENSANLIIGVRLCREHCQEFEPLEIENFEEICRASIGIYSPIPPDVERAWVKPLRLDSSRYLDFVRMRKKQ